MHRTVFSTPIINSLLRTFSICFLRLSGWKVHGSLPADASKRVDGPVQLIVPPEGTRNKIRYWKTGFYYIALGARVPIVMAYMDDKKKISGLGPVFAPSGALDADMAVIKAFYAPFKGQNADQFHAG